MNYLKYLMAGFVLTACGSHGGSDRAADNKKSPSPPKTNITSNPSDAVEGAPGTKPTTQSPSNTTYGRSDVVKVTGAYSWNGDATQTTNFAADGARQTSTIRSGSLTNITFSPVPINEIDASKAVATLKEPIDSCAEAPSVIWSNSGRIYLSFGGTDIFPATDCQNLSSRISQDGAMIELKGVKDLNGGVIETVVIEVPPTPN